MSTKGGLLEAMKTTASRLNGNKLTLTHHERVSPEAEITSWQGEYTANKSGNGSSLIEETSTRHMREESYTKRKK